MKLKFENNLKISIIILFTILFENYLNKSLNLYNKKISLDSNKYYKISINLKLSLKKESLYMNNLYFFTSKNNIEVVYQSIDSGQIPFSKIDTYDPEDIYFQKSNTKESNIIKFYIDKEKIETTDPNIYIYIKNTQEENNKILDLDVDITLSESEYIHYKKLYLKSEVSEEDKFKINRTILANESLYVYFDKPAKYNSNYYIYLINNSKNDKDIANFIEVSQLEVNEDNNLSNKISIDSLFNIPDNNNNNYKKIININENKLNAKTYVGLTNSIKQIIKIDFIQNNFVIFKITNKDKFKQSLDLIIDNSISIISDTSISVGNSDIVKGIFNIYEAKNIFNNNNTNKDSMNKSNYKLTINANSDIGFYIKITNLNVLDKDAEDANKLLLSIDNNNSESLDIYNNDNDTKIYNMLINTKLSKKVIITISNNCTFLLYLLPYNSSFEFKSNIYPNSEKSYSGNNINILNEKSDNNINYVSSNKLIYSELIDNNYYSSYERYINEDKVYKYKTLKEELKANINPSYDYLISKTQSFGYTTIISQLNNSDNNNVSLLSYKIISLINLFNNKFNLNNSNYIIKSICFKIFYSDENINELLHYDVPFSTSVNNLSLTSSEDFKFKFNFFIITNDIDLKHYKNCYISLFFKHDKLFDFYSMSTFVSINKVNCFELSIDSHSFILNRGSEACFVIKDIENTDEYNYYSLNIYNNIHGLKINSYKMDIYTIEENSNNSNKDNIIKNNNNTKDYSIHMYSNIPEINKIDINTNYSNIILKDLDTLKEIKNYNKIIYLKSVNNYSSSVIVNGSYISNNSKTSKDVYIKDIENIKDFNENNYSNYNSAITSFILDSTNIKTEITLKWSSLIENTNKEESATITNKISFKYMLFAIPNYNIINTTKSYITNIFSYKSIKEIISNEYNFNYTISIDNLLPLTTYTFVLIVQDLRNGKLIQYKDINYYICASEEHYNKENKVFELILKNNANILFCLNSYDTNKRHQLSLFISKVEILNSNNIVINKDSNSDSQIKSTNENTYKYNLFFQTKLSSKHYYKSFNNTDNVINYNLESFDEYDSSSSLEFSYSFPELELNDFTNYEVKFTLSLIKIDSILNKDNDNKSSNILNYTLSESMPLLIPLSSYSLNPIDIQIKSNNKSNYISIYSQLKINEILSASIKEESSDTNILDIINTFDFSYSNNLNLSQSVNLKIYFNPNKLSKIVKRLFIVLGDPSNFNINKIILNENKPTYYNFRFIANNRNKFSMYLPTDFYEFQGSIRYTSNKEYNEFYNYYNNDNQYNKNEYLIKDNYYKSLRTKTFKLNKFIIKLYAEEYFKQTKILVNNAINNLKSIIKSKNDNTEEEVEYLPIDQILVNVYKNSDKNPCKIKINTIDSSNTNDIINNDTEDYSISNDKVDINRYTLYKFESYKTQFFKLFNIDNVVSSNDELEVSVFCRYEDKIFIVVKGISSKLNIKSYVSNPKDFSSNKMYKINDVSDEIDNTSTNSNNNNNTNNISELNTIKIKQFDKFMFNILNTVVKYYIIVSNIEIELDYDLVFNNANNNYYLNSIDKYINNNNSKEFNSNSFSSYIYEQYSTPYIVNIDSSNQFNYRNSDEIIIKNIDTSRKYYIYSFAYDSTTGIFQKYNSYVYPKDMSILFIVLISIASLIILISIYAILNIFYNKLKDHKALEQLEHQKLEDDII